MNRRSRRGLNHQLNQLFSPNLKRYILLKQLLDKKQSTVSLPNETKQEVEKKHVPEQKKESKEPVKSIVQQSKAEAERSSGTKIKPKETSNVVKSNDGFWD